MRCPLSARILLLAVTLPAATVVRAQDRPRHPSALSDTARLAVNRIDLPLADPVAFGDDGTTWYPAGQSDAAILFNGGPVVTGLRDDEPRSAASIGPGRMQEWRSGPWGSDPFDPLNRFYRVRSGDGPGSYPYREWSDAVAMGAPFRDRDGDGRYDPEVDTPPLWGDALLWAVFNDSTSEVDRNRTRALPIGLELHQTVWAYRDGPLLDQVILFHHRFVYAGDSTLDSVYHSIYFDPDIGEYPNDRFGCDTTLNLGYAYAAIDNDDIYYGKSSPAVGMALLQGPPRLSPGDTARRWRGPAQPADILPNRHDPGMTAFVPHWGYGFWPAFVELRRVQIGGFNEWGSPLDPREYGVGATADTDPRFVYSGDPVAGTGWRLDRSQDYRLLLSSGPTRYLPGDTTDLLFALVVGQGSDPLKSVVDLKRRTRALRRLVRDGAALYITGEGFSASVGRRLELTATGLTWGWRDTPEVEWRIADRPAGSNPSIDRTGPNRISLIPDRPGQYAFAGMATVHGRIVRDTLRFTVTENRPPVVRMRALPPSMTYGDTLLLDARNSVDPDGDSLRFEWGFPNWVDAARFLQETGGTVVPARTGVAPIRLRLDDGTHQTLRADTVTIHPLQGGMPDAWRMDAPGQVRDVAFRNGWLYLLRTEAPHLLRMRPDRPEAPEVVTTAPGNRLINMDSVLAVLDFDHVSLFTDSGDGNLHPGGSLGMDLRYLEALDQRGPFLFRADRSEIDVYRFGAGEAEWLHTSYLPLLTQSIVLRRGDGFIAVRSGAGTDLIRLHLGMTGIPVYRDSLFIPGMPLVEAMAIAGERLVLLDPEGVLQVVETGGVAGMRLSGSYRSEPVHPAFTGLPELRGGDDPLLLLSSTEGVRMISVADPDNPHSIGYRYSGQAVLAVARDSLGVLAVLPKAEFHSPRELVLMRADAVGRPVTPAPETVPDGPWLGANYPNPFNPSTRMEFGVPDAGWVTLVVYDILGRKVATLLDGMMTPGRHTVRWDGRSDAGNPVASGVYVYRMAAGDFSAARKMLLVR